MKNLVGKCIGLFFLSSRVLLLKFFFGSEPSHHCAKPGHLIIKADRTKRLPLYESRTNFSGNLL